MQPIQLCVYLLTSGIPSHWSSSNKQTFGQQVDVVLYNAVLTYNCYQACVLSDWYFDESFDHLNHFQLVVICRISTDTCNEYSTVLKAKTARGKFHDH